MIKFNFILPTGFGGKERFVLPMALATGKPILLVGRKEFQRQWHRRNGSIQLMTETHWLQNHSEFRGNTLVIVEESHNNRAEKLQASLAGCPADVWLINSRWELAGHIITIEAGIK